MRYDNILLFDGSCSKIVWLTWMSAMPQCLPLIHGPPPPKKSFSTTVRSDLNSASEFWRMSAKSDRLKTAGRLISMID